LLPEPTQPDARDYLRPILRRKWWIIGFVVLATALTYAYFASKPKVYAASTKVLIQPTSNPLDPNGGGVSDRVVSDQAALLKSRDVATQVARQIGRPGQSTSLASSVTTTAQSGSSFVFISARRASPEEAARVANAFAQAFIRLRASAQRDQVQNSINEARAQLAHIPNDSQNRSERNSLEDSVRQLQLTLLATGGSASQVDPALPPSSAVAPHPLRNAVLALIVSLIGACGLAYALEALDRRARLEDFAALYGMPVLAALPRTGTTRPRTPEGVAMLGPVFKEPFRQLRANIQFADLDHSFKRILVTSAIPGEGKSTVVRNLAIALREGGLRVATVDGDLRQPTLAQYFGRFSEPGLTNVLMDRGSLQDSLVSIPVDARGLGTLAKIGVLPDVNGGHSSESEESAQITLLPSGPQPPDPHAVLAADRTRTLLDEVSAAHDVVLVDAPPLLSVTDALAIASWADAVIVVGRLGKVTRDQARRVLDVLSRVPDARPIGVVVNDVRAAESNDYGYGHGYGGYGG
jgi:Mrp family chromosome partitioning ATPase/capsular polysaccharide biosynthesis protein